MKVCWVQGGVEVEQKVPIVFFHLTLIRGQRKKSTPLFILESFTVQAWAALDRVNVRLRSEMTEFVL